MHMPHSRDYNIDLPITVTVFDNGMIDYKIDTSQATKALMKECGYKFERFDLDTAINDVVRVQEAVPVIKVLRTGPVPEFHVKDEGTNYSGTESED